MLNMNARSLNQLLVVATAGASVAAISFLWLRYNRKSTEKKWISVGHLKSIFIYPIKSCKGVSVREAQTSPSGLIKNSLVDRSFMIVRTNGHMITGREMPKLVTVEAAVSNNSLSISLPDGTSLNVDLQSVQKINDCNVVTVWKDKCPGLDCGDEIAKFISMFLFEKPDGARLVYHGQIESTRVNKEPKKLYPRLDSNDNSLYADLTGFMLMTESSLGDLNSRLEKPVSIKNFRPNLLVEGCQAFDEDKWTTLKIGSAVFRNISPCSRCVFTTVNAETGVKDALKEPLQTLQQYRLAAKPALRAHTGNAPLFGINLGLNEAGSLQVGDEVFATFE